MPISLSWVRFLIWWSYNTVLNMTFIYIYTHSKRMHPHNHFLLCKYVYNCKIVPFHVYSARRMYSQSCPCYCQYASMHMKLNKCMHMCTHTCIDLNIWLKNILWLIFIIEGYTLYSSSFRCIFSECRLHSDPLLTMSVHNVCL